MNHPTFHRLLLSWYDQNHRILPWRETTDPYAIWVSEIILQQTRVAQGYAYFERFMDTFPTVEALAAAPEEAVLLAWQGLGYYSRARNMHLAAQQIVAKGNFPTTYTAIRALRGVGDYTAAAICSLAFNQPFAVLDGNVYRVLSRLYDDETPIDTPLGKKHFQHLADELLNASEPRHHNQAMMELGALQCVPKNPDCEACTLHTLCQAYAHHTVAFLPLKSKKTQQRDRYFAYFLYLYEDKIFIEQRLEKDIWQHLYEFVLVQTPDLWDATQAQPYFYEGVLERESKAYLHILSHQRLHSRFFVVRLSASQAATLSAERAKQTISRQGQWVSLSSLPDYAFPRLLVTAYTDCLFPVP